MSYFEEGLKLFKEYEYESAVDTTEQILGLN